MWRLSRFGPPHSAPRTRTDCREPEGVWLGAAQRLSRRVRDRSKISRARATRWSRRASTAPRAPSTRARSSGAARGPAPTRPSRHSRAVDAGYAGMQARVCWPGVASHGAPRGPGSGASTACCRRRASRSRLPRPTALWRRAAPITNRAAWHGGWVSLPASPVPADGGEQFGLIQFPPRTVQLLSYATGARV